MPEDYEEDMAVISQPLDWAGVNYYTRSVIAPDPEEPHTGFKCLRGDLPKTDMGWEIEPEGLSFFCLVWPLIMRPDYQFISLKTAWPMQIQSSQAR